MGLRINTNVASLTARRNLSLVSQRLRGNYNRLSSGLRIATAADDAAGLGISERMRARIRSYTVASRNAMDGISLAQTTDGALQEVNGMLSRLRELAIQASNGTLAQSDRDTINAEFTELISEIDRVATTAEFNGIQLLDGTSTTVTIQVGIDAGAGNTIDVTLLDVRAATLGIDSLTTDTEANAQAALAAIDSANELVILGRGQAGAIQNRLQSALNSAVVAHENLSASESRIRDVDVAAETGDLTRNAIMQQAAVSVLTQANVQPQLALSLLG